MRKISLKHFLISIEMFFRIIVLLFSTVIITSCSYDQMIIRNNIVSEYKYLKKISIFFDENNYIVPEKYNLDIEQIASMIRKNKSLKIKIIGYTDRNGSSEYNIALGQRRANSVDRIIKIFGVNANQIEVISIGKEDCAYINNYSDEKQSEYRRVDIICYK